MKTDEGSLLPKYRDCTTSIGFELYFICCGVMRPLLIIYISIFLCSCLNRHFLEICASIWCRLVMVVIEISMAIYARRLLDCFVLSVRLPGPAIAQTLHSADAGWGCK